MNQTGPKVARHQLHASMSVVAHRQLHAAIVAKQLCHGEGYGEGQQAQLYRLVFREKALGFWVKVGGLLCPGIVVDHVTEPRLRMSGAVEPLDIVCAIGQTRLETGNIDTPEKFKAKIRSCERPITITFQKVSGSVSHMTCGLPLSSHSLPPFIHSFPPLVGHVGV